MEKPSLNRNEFLAVLMIHVEKSDANLSDEEIRWIEALLGKSTFEKAYNFYSALPKNNCEPTVLELKNLYYPGREGAEEILEYLREFFRSDGFLSKKEMAFEGYIKTI